MSDVVLFRPRYASKSKRPAPSVPLGLLYLAGRLIGNGYSVRIIDEQLAPAWDGDLAAAVEPSTLCVGVTALTGEQISWGLRFSKIVKERYGLPVVWGGIHATVLPEQTLAGPAIDYVIQGEGEDALLELVNAMKRGRTPDKVPGLWRKEGGRARSDAHARFIDLKTLPAPDYGLLDCKRYVRPFGVDLPGCERCLEVHTDRGCRLRINRRMLDAGIRPVFFILMGLPGEDRRDALQTCELMYRLCKENPDARIRGPHFYAPYPGTPLYDTSLRAGFRPPDTLEGWARITWEKPFVDSDYAGWLKKVVKTSFFLKSRRDKMWWRLAEPLLGRMLRSMAA